VLSEEVKTRLGDFYTRHQPDTGTDLFVIPKAHSLLKSEPGFVAALLSECEAVERSTWANRFALVHSTFELDYVALLLFENRLVGFASLGLVPLSDAALGLYLSEIMISPDFQRRGLSKELLLGLYEKVDVAQAEDLELITIVLSGHIALFRSLLSTSSSKAMSLSQLSTMDRSKVLDYLRRDIGDLVVSEDGVVEGVWAEQAVSLDTVWPRASVERLGLPSRVRLTHGDSVVRLYSLERTHLQAVRQQSQKLLETKHCAL
jgi:GNAT superfamily N-acetyltransferase